MNRVFRIIWSKSLRAWVVASELATRHGKDGCTVDRRTADVGDAFGPDAAEGLPAATPWPLRASILTALLTVYAPACAADRY